MWSETERRAILDDAFEAWRANERAEVAGDAAAASAAWSRWSSATERYRAGLPRVALSRCPHSGLPVELSFDPLGVDGLWWSREAGPQRLADAWPHTLVSFTGGVRLDGPPPASPLLTVLGPAGPAVVPSVLAAPEVTAVVSQVRVGAAVAWPVLYFAPSAAGLHRVNDWGAAANGATGVSADIVLDDDLDPDLGLWVESGRVLWTEPDDPALVLHEGTAGCPYLDLPPAAHVQRLQDGEVW